MFRELKTWLRGHALITFNFLLNEHELHGVSVPVSGGNGDAPCCVESWGDLSSGPHLSVGVTSCTLSPNPSAQGEILLYPRAEPHMPVLKAEGHPHHPNERK